MSKKLWLILFINICVAFLVTQIFLLSNNSLKNNGQWNSEKVGLTKWVMGSENFFSGTQPLSQGRLNLSAWHGFQEVTTKELFEFDQVEFDLFLEHDSYLYFFLKNEANDKVGVKLSEKENNSLCVRINQAGEYIEKQVIDNFSMPSQSWNSIIIRVDKEDLVVEADSQEIRCKQPMAFPSQIAFKGGMNGAFVDNIKISQGKNNLFAEDFSNHHYMIEVFILAFVSLNLIQSLTVFVATRMGKKKQVSLFILTVDLSVLLTLIVVFCYLAFYFSGNYPNVGSIFNKLKKQEEITFESNQEQTEKRLISKYYLLENEKIVFIGSSQTWGAGASDETKTFPEVFRSLVNKSVTDFNQGSESARILGISSESQVEVVNTAISGSTSEQALDTYLRIWEKLDPKLVIINLASNDFTYGRNKNDYRHNLNKIVAINKANQIETVFLLEANSSEANINNPFYEVIIEIAKENNLLVIDSNKYLHEKEKDGLVWWDFVHLTDYGQQVLAEYVFSELSQVDSNLQETDLKTY